MNLNVALKRLIQRAENIPYINRLLHFAFIIRQRLRATATEPHLQDIDCAHIEIPAGANIKVPATLRPAHFANTRLFADRIELIKSLSYLKHPKVAELGVAYGDFSRVIIDELNPAAFHAYDIFRFHEIPIIWGKPSTETLNGLQHKAFYEARFAKEIEAGQVAVFEGDGVTNLAQREDEFYDIIYIDADHRYEFVLRDTKASIKKLKHGGTLIFNDYIMYDHIAGEPYGIVQVVNDLCVKEGWQITHFAFETNMFCDIALRRSQSGNSQVVNQSDNSRVRS